MMLPMRHCHIHSACVFNGGPGFRQKRGCPASTTFPGRVASRENVTESLDVAGEAARSAARQAEGDSPPGSFCFWFRKKEIGAVEKWETCFWFSTFPSAVVVGAVGMWESRLLLARFPRGSWKEWEACLWLSTLSTAPAFPQLSRFSELVRRQAQPRRRWPKSRVG